MTQNDIYTALMNGADPAKLAQDYADMLNAAIDQKKAEDARIQKEKEAKVKAEQERVKAAKEKNAAQLADTQKVLDIVQPYLAKYYPDIDIKDMTAEDLMKALNSTIVEIRPLMKSMDKLFDDIFGCASAFKTKGDTGFCVKKAGSKVEDPITKFLKDFELL